MEGRPMPVHPSARKPGEDWIAIVRKNRMLEFAAAFVANPVLHTSVMIGPCVGVEAVAAVFAATAGGMCDTLAFTHETVDGPKTYLEWEGKAFGKSVGGTTILTGNEAGLIQSIQIYHRPLHMGSAVLGRARKSPEGKGLSELVRHAR